MFKSIRVRATGRSPLLVVGVNSDGKGRPATLDTAARTKAAREAIATPGFRADAGETAHAGGGMLLLGLGKRDDLTADVLRVAAARLLARLDRMSSGSTTRPVRIMLEGVLPVAVSPHVAGRAIGEGLGLANWRVDFFDGTATKTPTARPALAIGMDDRDMAAGVRDGLTVATCTNEARRLAVTPPNICNPAWIEREARRLARAHGLTCRVVTYTQAQKLGMGGIVNVGRASSVKPRLVILEHRPPRARKGTKIALVGKTITYDTGGYSLKPPASMKGMKYDGNGGCAVLGTMLAIAALKLPVHVVALLPTAENMVGGDAYRPDDIITMHNGVTVEVTNTDAEGRLVLADALSYACRTIKPTAIIDAATLTGGMVVALGSWCAGLFCNDDRLRGRIEDAGVATGDRVWRFPLWSEHRDFMRAKHADIWNSGPKRDGHPIQGAAFLSYFVDDDVPWAHLDIAGVSAVDGDQPPYVAGPTGFGVRLLTEVVAGYA